VRLRHPLAQPTEIAQQRHNLLAESVALFGR
jgi:hypothetical protein